MYKICKNQRLKINQFAFSFSFLWMGIKQRKYPNIYAFCMVFEERFGSSFFMFFDIEVKLPEYLFVFSLDASKGIKTLDSGQFTGVVGGYSPAVSKCSSNSRMFSPGDSEIHPGKNVCIQHCFKKEKKKHIKESFSRFF